MTKRVLFTSDRIGRGDDELGRLLVRNFMYSLARNPIKPSALLFMNEGVRLACEGSEVLDDLRLMAEDGIGLKVCGTCLDYLKLTDALAVGEVGTMPETVATMMVEGDTIVVG